MLPSGAMGDIIVEFTREQGNFVTPRGKYALQVGGTVYKFVIGYSSLVCGPYR